MDPPSSHPVVTGVSSADPFKNFGFTDKVLYDALTRAFRMWYTAYDPVPNSTYTAYTESADGIQWQAPRRLDSLKDFGVAYILDQGPQYPDPTRRFMTVVPADPPASQRAGNALFSPDGLNWTPYAHNPVTAGAYGEVWV